MKNSRVSNRTFTQVVLLTASLNSYCWAEGVSTESRYGLEEIIVTADLREQRSFEVPSSIQVVSGETIESLGYQSTEEIIHTIPNAHLSRYRTGLSEGNFTIRGVGATTVNVDQSIGFYIDGIPVTSVAEFGPELLDVDRIEILRGPQGTLYGRNALGGVFHIRTVEPQADSSAKAMVGYGSDNDRKIALTGNTPLGSNAVLARFSLSHNSRDGRIDNVAEGASDVGDLTTTAARGRVSFDVSDRLELLVSADISDSESTEGSGDFDAIDDQTVNSLRPVTLTKKTRGLSMKAEYVMDGMTFVSLTSVRTQDDKGHGGRAETQSYDPDNAFTVPFNNDFTGALDQKTLTQELRLESDTALPLSWIMGVFYQRNQADRISDLVNVSLDGFERSLSTTKDDSLAAFADATYAFSERSSLTAGLRVNRDRKRLDYHHEGSLVPVLGFQAAPNQVLSLNDNFQDISPRLAYEFQPNNTMNVFVKVAKGYKSGGYNTEFLRAGDNHPYKKESIVSYEAGIKAISDNEQLEMDITTFYMDWTDQQILDFSGLGLTTVENADESRSQGVEVQLRAAPTDNLILTASAGYVDAELKTASATLVEINGNQQPNTPELTASLGTRYQRQVTQTLTGFVSADLSYQSEFYWDIKNTLEEPAHAFLNLSVGAGNDDVQLSAYLKNATDEAYNVSAVPETPGFFAAQNQPGFGRELGIRLTTTLSSL